MGTWNKKKNKNISMANYTIYLSKRKRTDESKITQTNGNVLIAWQRNINKNETYLRRQKAQSEENRFGFDWMGFSSPCFAIRHILWEIVDERTKKKKYRNRDSKNKASIKTRLSYSEQRPTEICRRCERWEKKYNFFVSLVQQKSWYTGIHIK